jgi:uncharacterized protein (TIGR03437 family)
VDYSFPLDSHGAVMNLAGGWTAQDLAASQLPTLAPAIWGTLNKIRLPIGQTWTVIKSLGTTYSASCATTVQLQTNDNVVAVQNWTFLAPNNNDRFSMVREMTWALFTPCGFIMADNAEQYSVGEGVVSATAAIALTALANAGVQGFSPVTFLGLFQPKLEQDYFAVGGGYNFMENNADILAVSAPFEMFASKMGNSFIPLDQLWAQIPIPAAGQNLAAYINALDQAVGMVGGRMPSTWISLMPQFFSLSAQQRIALGWTAESDPTNGLWLEAYAFGLLSDNYRQTIVSPSYLYVLLRQRQGGTTTFATGTHTGRYVVKNSSGTVVYDTTFPITNGVGGFGFSITQDGLYTTETFLYDNGVVSNMLPGEFPSDSTGWSASKLVVTSPGVKLELAPGQPPYTLTYVDDTNIAAIGNLPASYTEVLLTDGTVTRPFVYVPSAPNGTMVWNWFQFDNPKLLVPLNAVTWTPLVIPQNQVSPGEWITLDTLGANHGNPDFTALVNGAFPVTAGVNVWGSTQVVFSLNGQTWNCAMNYVGANQVNVQVCPNLPVGQTVNVQVSVNGVLSNSWPLQIVADTPDIFMVQADGYSVPAITFATGSKIGQVVTPANPAPKGQALSLYYTGCGTLSQPQQAGVPAPLNYLVYATDQSTLMVGNSQAQILFNGLAPGYVGLCQMNFVVPGLPALIAGGNVSSSPIGLTVGGNPANSVVLSVQ